MIAIVVHVPWEGKSRSQAELSLQHFWFNELLQVGSAEPSVPGVGDVTPVHDVTHEVAQVIVGDLAMEQGGLSPARSGLPAPCFPQQTNITEEFNAAPGKLDLHSTVQIPTEWL